MRFVQAQYLRQCHADYMATFGQCERCGPKVEPIRKRWRDAVQSLAAYVRYITGKGDTFCVSAACDEMGESWFGVYEGDSYDSVKQSWYWRILEADPPRWANTSVDAFIAFTNAIETQVGASPRAESLVFIISMHPASCVDDDHNWEFLYTDRGSTLYRCQICDAEKWHP